MCFSFNCEVSNKFKYADIYFILSVSDTFNKRSDIIRVSDAEAIRGGGSSIDFDFFWAVSSWSRFLS